MIRLHLLLRDHSDAVEADLHRFYGVDVDLDPRGDEGVLSVLRGRLSLWWLLRRLRHVPHGQGAATRALDGPEVTPERLILSDVWRWLMVVHGDGHKDPGPHPVIAPPEADEDEGPSTAALDEWERRKVERAEMLAREG